MYASVPALLALAFSCLPPTTMLRPDESPGPLPPLGALVLTSFEDNDWGWYRVLDGVMGGRSSGRFELREGRLEFRGVLNTNGGGFASVRSRARSVSLRGQEGLRLRLRGDGRRYSIRLSQSGLRSGVTYRADVETVPSAASDAVEPGPWQTVWLPFASFEPQWRGRQLDLPPLDLDRVVGLGLTVADGVDGPFRVEVDEIAAYPPFDLAQLKGERSALVVIAPVPGHSGAARWASAFERMQDAAPKADVVLVRAAGEGDAMVEARGLNRREVRALRSGLGCDPGTFMVRLVRMDGTVESVDTESVDLARLWAASGSPEGGAGAAQGPR